jgi:hypothetical protein
MGFMTEISILNDQFSTIEKNPERFVQDIRQHMNFGGQGVGQCTILKTHHSDDARVLFSHQNTFMDFDSPLYVFTKSSSFPDSKREIEFKLKMLEQAQEYLNQHRRFLKEDLERVSK